MPSPELSLRIQRRTLTDVFNGYATRPWHTALAIELPCHPLLQTGTTLSLNGAAALAINATLLPKDAIFLLIDAVPLADRCRPPSRRCHPLADR